jgi:hypothetical protein
MDTQQLDSIYSTTSRSRIDESIGGTNEDRYHNVTNVTSTVNNTTHHEEEDDDEEEITPAELIDKLRQVGHKFTF